MHLNRRQMIAAAITSGVRSGFGATSSYKAKPRTGPSMDELARAAAAPVLKRDGLDRPVIIDSIELLKAGKEYFVRVRSKDGGRWEYRFATRRVPTTSTASSKTWWSLLS